MDGKRAEKREKNSQGDARSGAFSQPRPEEERAKDEQNRVSDEHVEILPNEKAEKFLTSEGAKFIIHAAGAMDKVPDAYGELPREEKSDAEEGGEESRAARARGAGWLIHAGSLGERVGGFKSERKT